MSLPERMGTQTAYRFLFVLLAAAWIPGCGPADKDSPADDEAASELEAVLETISTQWAAVETMTADVTMVSTMAVGPVTVRMEASGTFEFLRGKDENRFRMDLTNTVQVPVMGESQGKILAVCDGETVFQEMSLMGQTKVVKTKPENMRSGMAAGDETLSELLHKQGDVILLPDETIDETPVYVIEVVLNKETREAMAGAPARSRSWFAKDTGTRLRIESFDKSGESMSLLSYSGLALGPELDPARFQYTPPDGASVVDVLDRNMDSMTTPF